VFLPVKGVMVAVPLGKAIFWVVPPPSTVKKVCSMQILKTSSKISSLVSAVNAAAIAGTVLITKIGFVDLHWIRRDQWVLIHENYKGTSKLKERKKSRFVKEQIFIYFEV
jgi:hypothetical protein